MHQLEGLSLDFLEEVVNCANYIVNQTTTKVLKNTTPEQAWSLIKLYAIHFHVFGNETWAHILDEKHKSLEPKNEKCIFFGYSKYLKGYRLQINCKEIIIRQVVNFNENVSSYKPNVAYVAS